MSLTQWIRTKEVARRLDQIIPDYAAALDVALIVESRTNRAALMGTAFDYLVRFELLRRCPHSVHKRWVAELSVALLGHLEARNHLHGAAQRAVAQARICTDAYANRTVPDGRHRRELAIHALRLARFDTVYRTKGRYAEESILDEPSVEEIAELLELFEVVPFDRFVHQSSVSLNPHFGWCSVAVQGADADVITGDRLIDLKTTAKPRIDREMVRQLVGYFLLARLASADGAMLPELTSLELYFARYAAFRAFTTAEIVSQSAFAETEEWFRQHVVMIDSPATQLARTQLPWVQGREAHAPVMVARRSTKAARVRVPARLTSGARRRAK